MGCKVPWVLDPFEEVQRSYIIALICLETILTVSSVTLNLSGMLVIRKMTCQLGTAREVLLGLCFSDLCYGLLVLPTDLIFLLMQLHGQVICEFSIVAVNIAFTFLLSSFMLLILATGERYLCIMHPFFYQRHCKPSTWIRLQAFVGLFSVCCISLHLATKASRNVAVFAAFLVFAGCIFIAIAYAKIVHKAFKVKRTIEHQVASIQGRPPRRVASANMMVVVVAATLICYAPFGLTLFTRFLTGQEWPAEAICFFFVLVSANATLNPICYCLLNKPLRHRMVRFWKGKSVFGSET